ncbi:hypothetical protein [Streptomyces iconiensis]|uniref:Uncharacterized protein n=1 Tax=Streptomyces iconiensis TaxID=1384038 RepID=A0ABT7A395_9ACTN|nr:hypothetical protein [Streptomyces iconiensis]MDJ1135800.1 hypothetical protein [Streptomyces iconiensis]
MSESTADTLTTVTGTPARPVAPETPDIEALRSAVVEAFFGILESPDDTEALSAGVRVLAELDAA